MRNVRPTQPAPLATETRFTRNGSGPTGSQLARWPRIVSSGYPGGCATPKVSATVTNSAESPIDRKSTRLNSSHVSLHDALPICEISGAELTRDEERQADAAGAARDRDEVHAKRQRADRQPAREMAEDCQQRVSRRMRDAKGQRHRDELRGVADRSEEHTSELQSRFPTRRASDLRDIRRRADAR